jgi:hypothetical protein
MKLPTHGYDKMEGIPKDPMPLILVQNTTFHSGLQNFHNNFMKIPDSYKR